MFRRMLGALGCTLLFFVVFAASYSLIGRYFRYDNGLNKSQENGSLTPAAEAMQVMNPGTAEEKAKELIFVTDETGDIVNCYLSILRCDTGKLILYRIPASTRLQISDEMYLSMGAEAGSVLTLSDLFPLFDNSAAYLWGENSLEEMLGLTVSYTTIYNETIFSAIITADLQNNNDAGIFNTELGTMISEAGGMKAYLTWLYQNSVMNLSLQDRLVYLETLEALQSTRIEFQVIAGSEQNGVYEVDITKAEERFREALN